MKQNLVELLHCLLLQLGLEIRLCAQEWWKGEAVQGPASAPQPRSSVDTYQTVHLFGIHGWTSSTHPGALPIPKRGPIYHTLCLLTAIFLLERIYCFPKHSNHLPRGSLHILYGNTCIPCWISCNMLNCWVEVTEALSFDTDVCCEKSNHKATTQRLLSREQSFSLW